MQAYGRPPAPPPPAEGLRVLVVDATAAGRDELTGLLSANPAVGTIASAPDAVEALRLLHRAVVDIAFVGVDIPGLDAFDFARVLQQFGNPPVIVFVAADGGRAADAFDVGATDFLLRPLAADRVAESLRRTSRYPRPDQPLAHADPTVAPAAIPTADVNVWTAVSGLDASSVRWIEVQRDFVRVHTASGTRLLNVPLGHLVVSWAAAGIVRIHRTYAVQLGAVSEFRRSGNAYSVVVDGRELPVSRRTARLVKARLAGGAADLRNRRPARTAPRNEAVAA